MEMTTQPSATPEPYAHEWHITVKADEHAGAIDALFNCIRSFQSGAEPIGGTCPRSMGNRMTYDVEKGRDTRDLEIAALQQAGRDAIATMQQDQQSIRDLLAALQAAKADIERMAVERDANLCLLNGATREGEALRQENLKLKLQAATAKFKGDTPPRQCKDPLRGP